MDEKIAKLWHWHENLQSVLNDIREAQGLLIKAMKESDNEKTKSILNNLSALIEVVNDNLNFSADFLNSIKADSMAQELKNKLD